MTTTETPAVVTSQGSGSPGEGRNALVFVPGISRSWGDRSLRQIADDIVVAMNRLTTGHEFAAAPADPIAFSAGDNERSARRISITRIGTAAPEAKPVTVLDLVELEYARALAASNEAKPLLVRAILVLYALVRGARQFLGILNPSRQGKSRGQRIQLLFLFFILGVYAAFLGILVAAIVDLALQALATAQAALGGGATAAAGRPTPSLTTADPLAAGGQIVHFLSLAAVVVWTVLPPKARVKEGITNTATDFLTMDYYLRTGLNAPRLQGDLYGLLDALRDGHPEGSYRRIDVASYSLGSIVAFNALFPYGSPPAVGSPVAAVDTFVTIGCPFDTIRLVRPGYFHGRRRLAGAPRRWLNVYTPNDLLGSNFRNDDADEQPDDAVFAGTLSNGDDGGGAIIPHNVPYYVGGVPQAQGRSDALVSGMRAHAGYWDSASGGESTCFEHVVVDLYRTDGTLGTAEAAAAGGNSLH